MFAIAFLAILELPNQLEARRAFQSGEDAKERANEWAGLTGRDRFR